MNPTDPHHEFLHLGHTLALKAPRPGDHYEVTRRGGVLADTPLGSLVIGSDGAVTADLEPELVDRLRLDPPLLLRQVAAIANRTPAEADQ